MHTEKQVTVERSLIFPLDWIGKYEGSLNLYTSMKDTGQVDMKLFIDYPNPEGYYPWTLVYGESDTRYYGLEVIDPEKGLYRIDEYNSIRLNAYLRGNHLISSFRVQDSDIIVDYEKIPEGIHVRFYITAARPGHTTGGEIIGRDTVPLVKLYPLVVFQEAILRQRD